MSNQRKSAVWKYFKSENQNSAICNLCKPEKRISCAQYNTSSMRRHLTNVHHIKFEEEEPEVETKKLKLMDNFLIKTSLEQIVSKLASIDGFSIRSITNSEFIRQSISARGYKLPKSESSVMNLITNYAEKIQLNFKEEIKQEISEGKKYSITLDEWTSCASRRYMNINLHKFVSKDLNLGLVRINGSCNAERMVDLVKNHLKNFGISYEHDIVGATGDGASVMLKFGKISPCIYQTCLNHGLHLGVIKTFYKKSINENVNINSEEDNNFDNFSDDDAESDDEMMEFQNYSIEENLTCIRKIVKFFKFSAVRSDAFKQKLRDNSMLEQQLLLDCKTRWNSMLKMVEKFLKLKDIILETLQEFGTEHLMDDLDIKLLETLLNALKPVEIAVNAMSEKKATLTTAVIAIEFMREKLSAQKNNINNTLLENINFYIDQRLNIKLNELVKSLINFDKAQSKSTIELAIDLMKRLFNQSEVHTENALNEISNKEFLSLEDELRSRLTAANSCEFRQIEKFSKIRQEFSISKANGKLTENLTLLSNAINTIKPTSIDPERTFSVANNFCTKIRSKLSDKSLSNLVLLKYYFLSIEK